MGYKISVVYRVRYKAPFITTKKRYHTAKTAWRWVLHYIFDDHFYSPEMPESSDFMYSSFLMLENI